MSVIGYETKMLALYNLLNNANVTGATQDLSNNMSRRVQGIYYGDPSSIPKQIDLFPCVFIYCLQKTNEFTDIAKGAQKLRSIIDWDIVGLTYVSPTIKDSNTQVHYLAENIEEILRNTPKLSGVSDNLWNTVMSTDFDSVYSAKGNLASARVRLQTKHLY